MRRSRERFVGLARAATLTTPTYSHQPSAEHFQQSAEFLPLCNCGLGPLAVTVLPIPFARRAAAPLAPLLLLCYFFFADLTTSPGTRRPLKELSREIKCLPRSLPGARLYAHTDNCHHTLWRGAWPALLDISHSPGGH